MARSYFAAWTSRQGPEALRALMAPEFVFDAGPQRVDGREAFISAGGWPDHATTTMLAEAYDGNHAFQLYLGTNADRQVKIADHPDRPRQRDRLQ